MAAPTFLGIGAMKAGTSTIHRYMEAHPEIYALKEVDFFLEHSNKAKISQTEYESLFPASYAVRGEYATHYDHGLYLQRIRKTYPDIKLIYSLRHPIDRFISDVRHMLTNRLNDRDAVFYDVDNIIADYHSGRHERWQLSSGFYDRTLRWIAKLGMTAHLINFDDLRTDQQQNAWNQLTAYLGVAQHVVAPIHENSSEGRLMLALTEQQREQLDQIYEPTMKFLREEHGINFA